MVLDQLKNGLKQNIVVFSLGFIVYLVARFFHWTPAVSFFDFIGLKMDLQFLDFFYLQIWIFSLIAFSVFIFLQITCMPFMDPLLKSSGSPYWKHIQARPSDLLTVFLYCVLIAGLSEEVLFRGLIGIRSMNFFGFWIGNILQAFLFFLAHLLIVRFVVGRWIHPAQVVGFFASFPLALICGFLSYRSQPVQILPAILFHSSMNFASYLLMVTAHRLGYFRG